MISISGLDYLKSSSELQADSIPGGVLYLIIEDDTFTWRKASKSFDLDIFKVGENLSEKSIAKRAMKEKKTLVENIPRSIYGVRLKTIVEPLVNDKGECVGAFSIIFPLIHPIMSSFKDFAPVLAEMFSEGAVIYATDLQKLILKQASSSFDVDFLKPGKLVSESPITKKVIESKKEAVQEINDPKIYESKLLITIEPIFSSENKDEVIGTLGIAIPKKVAQNLINMSENMETGLSGISAAIEQLAASASQIHTNEQKLNQEISEVSSLSEQIIELSYFIKKIADETKMLGLNAAIESARAGEAGKGFGVVSQQIRKLSDQSKETVPKIKSLTDKIKEKADNSSKMSENSMFSSQEQASATEEVTASIEELTALSTELNKIAHKL
ncbi:methyl-accepting chemotaxis protein [Clostridium neuense]|uniref:Methyl-accepting chemotaxis protein n=1 Tax=Clostridium neuense TaxID=1728934 RepID=A0ABW8TLH6_9CLOT